MSRLRSFVKSGAEFGLVASGASGLVRMARGFDAVVLSYHNIVPDGLPPSGDQSLHLPVSRLRQQLDQLSRTHDIVPLDTLFAPLGSSRPRAVVTFDDAYWGAVTLGVEELTSRHLPLTIFVAPGILGGQSMWWDELADAQSGEVPEARRNHCLEHFAGRDASVREWARAERLALRPARAELRTVTEQELILAADRSGVTIGSHSWSHTNLTRLDPKDLDRELSESWNWLRGRFKNAIPWIAYPYGLGGDTVGRAAARNGYAGGFLVTGGPFRARGPAYDLPRVNVAAGLSARGLALRLAGL